MPSENEGTYPPGERVSLDRISLSDRGRIEGWLRLLGSFGLDLRQKSKLNKAEVASL